MIGHLHIIFAPLIPYYALEVLAVLAVLLVLFSFFHRAKGAFFRTLVFTLLLLAIANPSVIEEQRTPLKDKALLVLDDSASMAIGNRAQERDTAFIEITKKLEVFDDLDVEILRIKGSEETDLLRAIEQKLTNIPRSRLAGVIAMTDGQNHDQLQSDIDAPIHVLVTGHPNEVDRRITIKEAPAYGIVGKKISLMLRIEDQSKTQSEMANVTFHRADGTTNHFTIPVGQDYPLEVPIDHPGQNLFVVSTGAVPNELTTLNNMASVNVNGIRDRLRVLLISGQPHIGGRTWRNFLKADPAVDLIHFTILRSPMKQDNIPNSELSLIAFPVHELFETKLKSFDLVIFDRFRSQSLVADNYLENIADYVEQGGALLISNSTEDNVPLLTKTPFARVLPVESTGRLLTNSFIPDLTDAGKRHPVTASLINAMPQDKWGHWFRQIDGQAREGDVLMSGINNQPLLVLSHAKEGRVAQFLSDQFWLWSKGYEGGGPEGEMLRRVAHWLVKEPELDETALRAHVRTIEDGWEIVITKQSLQGDSLTVDVTDPKNQTTQVALKTGGIIGALTAALPVKETGLYYVKNGDQIIMVVVGPSNSEEYGDMRATEEKLAPAVKATKGSINWLADDASGPTIQRVSSGSTQSGWKWIGLRQNGEYRVTGSKAYPLLPAFALLILILGLVLFAWRREGQR